MRGIGVIAAQVFVSMLVTGAILPAIVVYAPGLTRSAAGPYLAFAAAAAIFAVLRLIWPKRRRES